MRPFFLLVGLCVFCSPARPQSAASFFKLSGPERCWVLGHLFVAKKAHRLSQSALEVCDSLKKQNIFTGNGNGDQLDAFRHVYWMALLAGNIKPKKAIKLGIAHEKGNYKAFKKGKLEDGAVPDSMSSVMDFANNNTGIELGLKVKNDPALNLVARVISEIKQGHAVILLKNTDQQFLTCGYQTIDLSVYSGKWSIPKCLVKSNLSE